MKILIVANGFPPAAYGGVEVYSYDLARELIRRGHQLQVFCRVTSMERPDYDTWLEEVDGIPVTWVVNDFKEVPAFRKLYADSTVDSIFARLLDDFQPDLVHFNHFLALSATLPFETKKRGIPSVATIHDYWTICHRINLLTAEKTICPGPKQGVDCYQCMFVNPNAASGMLRLLKAVLPFPVRRALRRLTRRPNDEKITFQASPADFVEREQVFQQALSCVNQLAVPSQFVRAMLAANGYDAGSIQVIPLGIGLDAQPARLPARKEVHFGFVGSVIPLKGLESLIRAFRSVPGDNICLDIYGRTDLHPLFIEQMRALAGRDRRIIFHGAFAPDQRAAVFAEIDILVMPSVWHETFSLVAREALRAGIPVIASRVGALSEVVQDGVNGYLYPPGDEVALRAIFQRISENPQALSGLQVPGPVDIIDVPEHVNRIEQVYDQVR